MKRKKNHKLGMCPCCRGTYRVTEDGRMYQHFQKGFVQTGPRACLGTGRPADSIMEDGAPDALTYPKGALM